MGNINAATSLRQGIASILNIEGQIAEIQEHISELKKERRATVLQIHADTRLAPKVIDQLAKEQSMDKDSRRAFEAQLEIARALLGTLDDTPLGEAARRTFERMTQRDGPSGKLSETWVPDQRQPDMMSADELRNIQPEPVASTKATPEELAQCRIQGSDAASKGVRLIENPYPAAEAKRRAAWDEGWCNYTGTDGMDIPDSLKPKKKPSKEGDQE